jgi:hypothetical protein
MRLKSLFKTAILSNTFVAKNFYRTLNYLRVKRAQKRNSCFGQCAEDKWFLDALRSADIPWANSGFFVDIGANHPVVFSSSYLLYKSGWRGITVEPIASLCSLHKEYRPRDICLNIGVAANRDKRPFWETVPDLFSSFSNADAQRAKNAGLCTIISEEEIAVETPSFILTHTPNGKKINYLSIDSEGLDTEILRHWPWAKSRPDVISCEALAAGDGQREIESILLREGYAPIKLFAACGFWGLSNLAAQLNKRLVP